MKSTEVGGRQRRLTGFGQTDRGRVRANNEDAFICDNDLGLYAVIDGVGGNAAGEVAAGIAKEIIRKRMARLTGSPEERLREAITLANNEIYRQSLVNSEWRGMTCVLTAALIDSESVVIGHVGDTRLYILRNGKATKATPDHSPIGEREDAGALAEIEAMCHPRRNEVLRDVGSEPHTPDDPGFIEIIAWPAASCESVLLCSDGLSDILTSEVIARIERQYRDNSADVVNSLIETANVAGGRDNITVVYIPGVCIPGRQETAAGRENETTSRTSPDRYRFLVRSSVAISSLAALIGGLLTILKVRLLNILDIAV